MEQHHKPINDKIYLYILNTSMIFSFFLICSITQDGLPVFVYLLLMVIEFFNSFAYVNTGINWEAGLAPVLVMVALVIFCSYDKFKNKYLMIICFFALLIFLISETGILKTENYMRINYLFIIPFLIYILSSFLLIFYNFKNKVVAENDNLSESSSR